MQAETVVFWVWLSWPMVAGQSAPGTLGALRFRLLEPRRVQERPAAAMSARVARCSLTQGTSKWFCHFSAESCEGGCICGGSLPLR